ncbi:pyridoxamine 5'-phosphate oxidase family protein [Defluviimonas aestuarii]|uniref:pyridoxamine 5'-phosphate oxidase family protein n=1 Tax=Albidovulum aestuarii TaxID=1130726 RepID=UPI00249B95DC|nr:pyridoxamine 5'-phosphate oxidase family protein [Defluviimonas aestuarii]MDI3335045.1 pyridoxamine 5'-phosphate oxidase family protein [Defluviimonas aestuarii]
MAKKFDRLAQSHRTFIEAQHLFFVATAAPTGRVNTSPKGTDSLRVMDSRRIIWRNSTGSGNESAGHILLSPRMTLMWCSFDEKPLILRAYGTATALHPGDDDWSDLNALFPPDIAARQIFDLSIDLVQTSCGFGVPRMTYEGERPDADEWSEKKGPQGIREYWAETNRQTLDGFPTGIPD